MKKPLLVAIAIAFALHANAQTYTPVTVTGFTADVIANGSGAVTNSTSADIDGSDYNLVAQNYVSPTNQTPTAFLPANGIINSAATTGLTYQLAAYTGNNSLRITGTGTGTLTFATPTNTDQIYLLATSANSSTFTATINFTDGTSQSFTNQTVNGWISGTGTIATQGIGRVLRTTNVPDNPANAPRLFELKLNLSAANASKSIQSITFTKTSAGTNEILHILGVTAKATPTSQGGDASIIAVSAPASGCTLSSTETITIRAKNNGTTTLSSIPVSYKINNGTPVNEVIPGPIAAGSSIYYSFNMKANLSTAGLYSIEARSNVPGDVAPGNDALISSVVLVSPPAMPTITTSGSATICTGGAVTLTASSATVGVTFFQWFKNGAIITNATNPTYNATTAGSYTVVASTNNCTSAASAAITVTVSAAAPPAAPGINVTGSLAICPGDSVALTATSTSPGVTFEWFRNGSVIAGATSATYVAKTAGNYTATATLNTCTSPASATRTVIANSIPATPTISQNGFTLTSSSSTGNQWFKDGNIIPGATKATYNTTANGSYTVKVTVNGCTSPASNAIVIANTGINTDRNNLQIALYPNPSAGLFNLTLPEGQTYELLVTDLTGRVIRQQTVKSQHAKVNLGQEAKGVYMLKIVSENRTATRKLIVE